MVLEYRFPNNDVHTFLTEEFILETEFEVFLLVYDTFERTHKLVGVVEDENGNFYYYNNVLMKTTFYKEIIKADENEEFEFESISEIVVKKNGIPSRLEYFLTDSAPLLIIKMHLHNEGLMFMVHKGGGIYERKILKKAI